ncbi:16S rRNA (cytidine(1402)-2'-O)-methyltransferase [Parvibaculaceae bacterium PLY_AMNH_Bact1]|nr:16S rRNA (cytidine(1402)-2'-O)-methyltransferase [Parvibaculaceae bacterium PLY_AMNH_Bact1]
MEPGLYIIATPIGNARDITLRALDVLAEADLVLCEDTRVTSKLFAIHGLKTPLRAYHEHNAAAERPKVIARIQEGAAVALVSDAGTPLISDPGYKLVQALLEEGLPVTTLPGASSVMAALTLAGLPTDRFLFAGFLPPKQAARRTALEEVQSLTASLVFLESPRRLAAMLADVVTALGDRQVSVARELTKKFEEVRRGTAGELAAHYDEAGAPKGEVVVIIGPPEGETVMDETSVDDMLRKALAQHSLKDAVAAVTGATGLKRREVYARALDLSKDEV